MSLIAGMTLVTWDTANVVRIRQQHVHVFIQIILQLEGSLWKGFISYRVRVRSFGLIRIRICDQDHTDHGALKELSFRRAL